jgi:TM2 domain-containing membrane protein YozV
MTPAQNPTLAALLCLIFPGLGQLYNGERAKGISMLIVALGMVISCLVFHSATTYFLMAFTYLAVLIPACIDANRVAKGEPSPFTGDAEWYIVVMLFAVGPFALPLLWQSKRFSRAAKITWTVLVILVALLAVFVLAALGPMVDEMSKNLQIQR